MVLENRRSSFVVIVLFLALTLLAVYAIVLLNYDLPMLIALTVMAPGSWLFIASNFAFVVFLSIAAASLVTVGVTVYVLIARVIERLARMSKALR